MYLNDCIISSKLNLNHQIGFYITSIIYDVLQYTEIIIEIMVSITDALVFYNTIEQMLGNIVHGKHVLLNK